MSDNMQMSTPRANSIQRYLSLILEAPFKLARMDPLALLGIALLIVLLTVTIASPWIITHQTTATSSEILQPPSLEHFLGTDHFGRDVFSRVISSLRLDFLVAAVGVGGAILLGSTIGLLCGYFGGWMDDIFMRVIDFVQAFPLLIVAMVLVVIMGAGVESVILATVIINIPTYARVIRAQVITKKGLEYIDAARCSGASEISIIFRHLMPNTLTPTVVHGSLDMAAAVGNVAVLSFLGMGIRPPDPDLGVMVSEGTKYLMQGAWWLSIFPGVVLALTMFSLNVTGDYLEMYFDPRRRKG